MLLNCPHCGDASEIPDDRLPPAGARGSCRACGAVVVFDGRRLAREGGADDATPANPLPAVDSGDDATPANPLDAVAGAAGAEAASGGSAPSDREEPADSWHVNTPSGQQGPFTLAQLKGLIRSGDLTDVDHVYGPGQTEWILAGDRDELKRYFAIKAKAAAAAAAAGAAPAAAAGSTEVDLFARCTRHPQAEAEWICQGCSVSWCPDCVELKKLPGGELWTCPQCERPCARREKKKEIVPWWTELGAVFSFPIARGGWIGVLVLSIVWVMQLAASAAPGPIGWMASFILLFAVLSWFVILIREVGHGKRSLPGLGMVEDYVTGLFIPGFKAMVVSILTFLPVLAYTLFVALPAVAEYGLAAAAQEQAWVEDSADSSSDLPAPTGSASNPQREAFIEAMRQMGASDEEIAQMLAEFDAEHGAGAADEGAQWEDEEDWEAPEPWRPDPPSGATVFLKLLGIPALLIYTLAVWPMLMIILAMFDTILPAFNPPLLLRIINEVRPAYLRLMLFLAPLVLLEYFVSLATSPGFGFGVGGAVRLVLVPFDMYLQILIMYVIGRTAEIIDNEIDWF